MDPGSRSRCSLGRDDNSVIAGLDPAIHLLIKTLVKWMDARVKPAHDDWRTSYASPCVSNIAALMASAAFLPAQTTNWNAGK